MLSQFPVVRTFGIALLIGAAGIIIYLLVLLFSGDDEIKNMMYSYRLWALIISLIFCLLFGIRALATKHKKK